MAVDVNAYAKELIDAAGLTDDAQRKAFEQFLSNDKVRAKLEPTLREATEGVERERGRTAAESAKAKAAEDRMNKYYTEQLKLANDNKAVVEAAQAEVARYEQAYGKLAPGERAAAVQNVIDQKALEERIGKTENLTVSLIKDASLITARHLRNFNEEPDFDAIQKIAGEKGLTAMKAYEDWAKPKYDEKQRATVEAETKAKIDAAVLEDRSQRAASKITDGAPRSEFLTNAIKSKGEVLTAKESFLKGWKDPNASATMKTEFGREH